MANIAELPGQHGARLRALCHTGNSEQNRYVW
jgi:hypothetical protein